MLRYTLRYTNNQGHFCFDSFHNGCCCARWWDIYYTSVCTRCVLSLDKEKLAQLYWKPLALCLILYRKMITEKKIAFQAQIFVVHDRFVYTFAEIRIDVQHKLLAPYYPIKFFARCYILVYNISVVFSTTNSKVLFLIEFDKTFIHFIFAYCWLFCTISHDTRPLPPYKWRQRNEWFCGALCVTLF